MCVFAVCWYLEYVLLILKKKKVLFTVQILFFSINKQPTLP